MVTITVDNTIEYLAACKMIEAALSAKMSVTVTVTNKAIVPWFDMYRGKIDVIG